MEIVLCLKHSHWDNHLASIHICDVGNPIKLVNLAKLARHSIRKIGSTPIRWPLSEELWAGSVWSSALETNAWQTMCQEAYVDLLYQDTEQTPTELKTCMKG